MTNKTSKISGLIQSLFGNLKRLLQVPSSSVPAGQVPGPVSALGTRLEPARLISPRVLLIVFDPVMDLSSGERLSRKMNWPRVDDLVTGFITDIAETSTGLARYQVVERVDLNEFPAKTDGFRYDPEGYMAVLRGAAPHTPSMVDYNSILDRFNIIERVNNREIDEVWLFGFPQAGFYESRMAGKGAFWCNSPALEKTSICERKFIIMGFSYERRVGEMLESFGHRCESILIKTFENVRPEVNLYEKFSRYDQKNPGKAEIGNIHFAPNSESDYDWNNLRMVSSHCDDWLHFPNLTGLGRQVNSDEWGNGDIRLHHKWWLHHLPRVAGRTGQIANNWWQYILDPNLIGL